MNAAAFDHSNLVRDGLATIRAFDGDTRSRKEWLELSDDLQRQLSSRSKNQSDGTISRLQRALIKNVTDHGNTKGECLSGASLGNTDKIPS